MTTLIAAIGAVAGLRALSGAAESDAMAALEDATASGLVVPRPPTTVGDTTIALTAQGTTTTTLGYISLGPLPSTTLVTPQLRRSPPPAVAPPPTNPPLQPPPPPQPPPPTTVPPVTTTVAPFDVVTYQLTGGWVRVVVTNTSVTLDGSGANDGFTQTVHNAGPAVVSVRFDSADHTSLLAVRIERGEAVVSVSETSR